MRPSLVLAWVLLGASASAGAQVSIQLGVPGVRIGIRIGGYPNLVAVPGYPVYYAPQLGTNLFFYDGLYWVYAQDQWYASSWYDGPWDMVAPESVPYFVLRVPVRYYRHPPAYFIGWGPDAPPRWGEHWGRDWDRHHAGWDRWDHASAPAPAPLPTYQRAYSGSRYPDPGQQRSLRDSNYHYQPHEAVARQQYARPAPQAAPAAHAAPAGRAAPSAAAPAARHSPAPESADRAATAARPENRAPAAAPPPVERKAPVERAPAPREAQPANPHAPAPANREPQRKPAEEPRSTAAPAAARPQARPAAEPRPARAPEKEQKKEPEHDRDH